MHGCSAANDTAPTETRTVEDILNEYHKKSFALETAQSGTAPAVRSSRSSASGKSLEEETDEFGDEDELDEDLLDEFEESFKDFDDMDEEAI